MVCIWTQLRPNTAEHGPRNTVWLAPHLSLTLQLTDSWLFHTQRHTCTAGSLQFSGESLINTSLTPHPQWIQKADADRAGLPTWLSGKWCTDRGTIFSFPSCKSQAGGGPAVQAAHHLLHLDAPCPTATPVLHWFCSLPEIQAGSWSTAGPAAWTQPALNC